MEQKRELDYKSLIEELEILCEKYDNFNYSYIGESMLKRPIPIITLGDRKAEKSVLYVSTHHPQENICTTLMLSFIKEYLEAYKSYRQLFSINLHYLYKMRKIYIVPMLNPDGVEYRLNGIDDDNPIKNRVIAYNEGENDFSKWNSNARGVDLNHNYNAGFEEYKEIEKQKKIMAGRSKYSGEFCESESETACLCNFIRFHSEELKGVISFHSQGEEIYYTYKEKAPDKSKHLVNIMERMTGYKKSIPEGTASYGGLTDWLISEFNLPAFTLECGKGKNPLPIENSFSIYSKLRELLFTFPIFF
ncbi:MAG: hypothetical protein IJW54_05975 [Clostridia bacterium]|nr:hypothetical protein [Clostridia bacterium]